MIRGWARRKRPELVLEQLMLLRVLLEEVEAFSVEQLSDRVTAAVLACSVVLAVQVVI